MRIQDYLQKRFSRVGDFYSPETEALQLSCRPENSLQEILPLLAEPTQSSLAVLDADRNLVGIITERDIIRCLASGEPNCTAIAVKTLMQPNPVTIDINDSCFSGLRKMLNRNFRNLLVLSEGRFVGILSVLQAAKGRLAAVTTKSEDLFIALQSMKDDLLISDITAEADGLFKDFMDSGKSIMLVSQDGQLVDYLTATEMIRLRLQGKNKIR